jgi:hypothetical protein
MSKPHSKAEAHWYNELKWLKFRYDCKAKQVWRRYIKRQLSRARRAAWRSENANSLNARNGAA